jgi:spore coat protein U-like protein
MIRTLSTLLLALFMAPFVHGAECANMQLQAGQTAFDMSLTPEISANLTVKANTQPGGCDYFLTFDYGAANSYSARALKNGSQTWPYQIYKDSGHTKILKNIPQTVSNDDVLTGTMPNNAGNDVQKNSTFWVSVDQSSPWLRFNMYTDWTTVSLYKGNLANHQFVSSVVLTFYYYAPKRVDISLVPTGGSFNLTDTTEILDFGTMVDGTTRACDVILKYNAGYMLYASSQNNGKLKHSSSSSTVNYKLSLNGTQVNLGNSASNPVQVFRELGTSPSSGKVIPAVVTIQDTSTRQTGSYSDIVTLTVQSSE